jgi:Leucine-rich repeat (LRR) protein
LHFQGDNDVLSFDIQLGIRNITFLDLSGSNLSDLTSIVLFTGLRELDCSNNNLTALDLTGLIDLEELNCSNNNLTELDVMGLTSLVLLDCRNNNMTGPNSILNRSTIPALVLDSTLLFTPQK